MNTLNNVHRRALVTASLTFTGIVLIIFFYWRGVSKGSLPSPVQPWVQKPESVTTNPPPVRPVLVAALPAAAAPKPLPPIKEAARTELNQPMPNASKLNLADAASLPEVTNTTPRTPPILAATNLATTLPSSARPAASNVSTNVTVEDQRVARQWLASTNDRPVIRVQYHASDVIRLATELNRGLLVAGIGSTTRREVFLESKSGKAPLFSPFTKVVAQRFADFSLALSHSTTFDPLTTPLPAYFPDGDYDLAFVPDRALATEIFAKAASVLRSMSTNNDDSQGIVIEGQLGLVGSQPTFAVLNAKKGGNKHTSALSTEVDAP